MNNTFYQFSASAFSYQPISSINHIFWLFPASFALFSLTIIHFKRLQNKPRLDESESMIDGVVSTFGEKGVSDLLGARIFNTSWSLDLGWTGVLLCVMTSVLWILLSKIMRFNPITSMINWNFLLFSLFNIRLISFNRTLYHKEIRSIRIQTAAMLNYRCSLLV